MYMFIEKYIKYNVHLLKFRKFYEYMRIKRSVYVAPNEIVVFPEKRYHIPILLMKHKLKVFKTGVKLNLKYYIKNTLILNTNFYVENILEEKPIGLIVHLYLGYLLFLPSAYLYNIDNWTAVKD
uniref:50S ribosomal protein L6 n=1 Tax=Heterorhabditis bacteriophora TaxID=37862 RepID=A0A1I7WA20_HETBA